MEENWQVYSKRIYKWINLQFFISQRSTFILKKLLLLILFVIDSHTVNNKQESKCLPLKVAFDVGFKHNGQIGLGLGRYHLGERAALTQFPTINLFINIIYLYCSTIHQIMIVIFFPWAVFLIFTVIYCKHITFGYVLYLAFLVEIVSAKSSTPLNVMYMF